MTPLVWATIGSSPLGDNTLLLEHPPGVWEVMGSIPVGNSDFSLSHLCHVDQLTFRTPARLLNYASNKHKVYYLALINRAGGLYGRILTAVIIRLFGTSVM